MRVLTSNFISNLRVAGKSLGSTLHSPLYLAVALGSAAAVLAFSIWLPNLGLIRDMTFSSGLPILAKLRFLWTSLGALGTNFSLLSATLTIVVSILLGLNIAVATSYFTKRFALQKASGVSLAGMGLGVLGVGCASCGSLILSAFVGVGATAAFTAFLPLQGQEFSVLSIAILGGALYITAKKSADPLTCEAEPHTK